MAQDMGQLTDMMMVNPWMFDPSQKSNQFSNYNNQRMSYPPTYNGVPTNAMGQPIQSFLDWQKANPGGTTLNSTPAMPQQAPATGNPAPVGTPLNPMGDWSVLAPNLGMGAQTQANYANALGLPGSAYNGYSTTANRAGTAGQGAATAGAAAQAAPQASPPPNNWQAALNALANPGNPVTPGATVPLQTGSQPSGGVNQAFLQQAGAGQGMNQNFLSALRAIQGR